jgi:predicted CopG family antitoxin
MAKNSKLITVQLDTYNTLQSFGTMKDTFDSVIRHLISDAEKWRVVENEFFRSLPEYLYKEESVWVIKGIIGWFKENGLLGEKWEKQFKESGLA